MSPFWLLAPPTAGLYAAVGLGGASGYLALGMLTGHAPEALRTQALWLNLVVASISLPVRGRAGQLRASFAAPILLTSVPAAHLAARATAEPSEAWRLLVGITLALAGLLAILAPARAPSPGRTAAGALHTVGLCAVGAGVGGLSGASGIGGGVLLAPALLLLGLADERSVAGVTTLLVLANSAAGLGGLGEAALSAPPPWAAALAVAACALAGAWFGSRRLAPRAGRRWLGVLLVAAGLRPVFAL